MRCKSLGYPSTASIYEYSHRYTLSIAGIPTLLGNVRPHNWNLLNKLDIDEIKRIRILSFI